MSFEATPGAQSKPARVGSQMHVCLLGPRYTAGIECSIDRTDIKTCFPPTPLSLY